MKNIMKIFLLLTMFLLVSCGGAKEEAKTDDGSETAKTEQKSEGQAEVAIVLKTLSNPFWV